MYDELFARLGIAHGVSREILDDAARRLDDEGGPLSSSLIAAGADAQAVMSALSALSGLALATNDELGLARAQAHAHGVEAQTAWDLLCVPLCVTDGALRIAFADPRSVARARERASLPAHVALLAKERDVRELLAVVFPAFGIPLAHGGPSPSSGEGAQSSAPRARGHAARDEPHASPAHAAARPSLVAGIGALLVGVGISVGSLLPPSVLPEALRPRVAALPWAGDGEDVPELIDETLSRSAILTTTLLLAEEKDPHGRAELFRRRSEARTALARLLCEGARADRARHRDTEGRVRDDEDKAAALDPCAALARRLGPLPDGSREEVP